MIKEDYKIPTPRYYELLGTKFPKLFLLIIILFLILKDLKILGMKKLIFRVQGIIIGIKTNLQEQHVLYLKIILMIIKNYLQILNLI